MEDKRGFALWITGLPASGKSSLAQTVKKLLKERNIDVEILESDDLRTKLLPLSTYTEKEREFFYNALVCLGKMLVDHGMNVIFDATANKRKFRDKARKEIQNFMEVYVKCPLEECMRRDPKGIYRAAKSEEATTVPGAQVPYEEPLAPEMIIESDRETPKRGAEKILQKMQEKFDWLYWVCT
ncbi:MAG: adenylyl-sulfate kinase [Actinomycetota bacterium]|nr:adenylyl-sulfate kinase [Actinomycetota bacterium]MDI6821320.1 adenylyl-sulfate kinase [Actinomycetota bacterium]